MRVTANIAIALFSLAAVSCIATADEEEAETASTESALWWPHPIDPVALCPTNPPTSPDPVAVGDAKSNDIIRHDSDVYWTNFVAPIAATDQQEADLIRNSFDHFDTPIWQIGRRAAAFVQMYDLLVRIDSCRANFYLERLRVMADALLSRRDDMRLVGTSHPVDYFRGRVMAAWGAAGPDRDSRWNTDVVIAGLFTYPMAAFARRIAANPTVWSAQYQQDAIRFTTAVMQTYESFRTDLYLTDASTWAYYRLPSSYSTLQCTSPVAGGCTGYRANAGQPLSWNENLSLMKSLAEAGIAADSQLYRSSPYSYERQLTLYYLTDEAPRAIAKNVRFFVDHLDTHTVSWPDGAVAYVWNHEYHPPFSPQIQNTPHAGFEIDSLVGLYEKQALLDGLLYRAGRVERINLSSTVLARLATTLLRKIWVYDYSNPARQNMLAGRVDGRSDTDANGNPVYVNADCGGFVPLTQIDPWVWVRCRDVTAKGYWREDNFAALLRYR